MFFIREPLLYLTMNETATGQYIALRKMKVFTELFIKQKPKVKYSQILSISRELWMSVPQGCTLWPVLFAIHVNCIGTAIRGYKYQLFADDTLIYVQKGDRNYI